ncbi:energy transducer TonB, partial [bacterium]
GSGNIYYDQSALRAIRKASPLPPLPQDLDEESLEVGINFHVGD